MSLDDDFLTPREAARILGLRVAALGSWARIGALKPAVRTPSGHRRYRRADVLAYGEAASIADPAVPLVSFGRSTAEETGITGALQQLAGGLQARGDP